MPLVGRWPFSPSTVSSSTVTSEPLQHGSTANRVPASSSDGANCTDPPSAGATQTSVAASQPAVNRFTASVPGPSRRSACSCRGAALLLITSSALRY